MKKTPLHIDIFDNIMRQFGHGESGTYNPNDPTHYDSKRLYVGIEETKWSEAHTVQPDEEDDYCASAGTKIPAQPYPEQHIYRVDWNDITWGHELRIWRMDNEYFHHPTLLMEQFLDADEKKWTWKFNSEMSPDEYIEFILTRGTFIKDEKEAKAVYKRMNSEPFEDPMGTLSDYE